MVEKTCHGKFVELIPSILENEPLTTPDLYESVKIAFPECINEEKCIHGNGGIERNGYEWQHLVRMAQAHLKIKGEIDLLDHVWYIPENQGLKNKAEEREVELTYESSE